MHVFKLNYARIYCLILFFGDFLFTVSMNTKSCGHTFTKVFYSKNVYRNQSESLLQISTYITNSTSNGYQSHALKILNDFRVEYVPNI